MEAPKNSPDSLPVSPIWREAMDWPDKELIHSETKEELAKLKEECEGFDDRRRLTPDEFKQQVKEWQEQLKRSFKKLIKLASEDSDSNWVFLDSTHTWREVRKKLGLIEGNNKIEAEKEIHEATQAILEEFKKDTISKIRNSKEYKESAEAYWFNKTQEWKHTFKLSEKELERANQRDLEHSAWRNPNQKRVDINDFKSWVNWDNYGEWYVKKVSIKKYNKETWIEINPNWSIDIQSNSTNLVVWWKVAFSNNGNINDLFMATSKSTISIGLEQIKEISRRRATGNINLSFAEEWWKYYNINLGIAAWSLSINNKRQISWMPKNLSEEMVKGKIDDMILNAISAWKISIEVANDMHFNYWPYTREIVNKFLTQQLTAEDMNKMRVNW